MPAKDPFSIPRPRTSSPPTESQAHAASRQKVIDRIVTLANRFGFTREPLNLNTTVVVLHKGPICCTVGTGRGLGVAKIRWSVASEVAEADRLAWLDRLDRKLYGPMGTSYTANLRYMLDLLERQMRALPPLTQTEVELQPA